MTITLNQITNMMFKNRFERTKIDETLKPYFYRYIGVSNASNYDNYLKTLESKCIENKEISLIFDGEVPFTPEMELINYIYNEINNMNIDDIQNEDIVIFQHDDLNKAFLSGLQYIINLARKKENFINDNILKNFITKQIVLVHSTMKNIDFKQNLNPKCIYYGTIDRHTIYYLILIYKMGVDVLYINPLKEEFFDEIEGSVLSDKIENMTIINIDTFYEHTKKGSVIDSVETITKQIEREVQQELFTGTGMYAPWQFRGGYTKSILLETITEDIMVYFREPSKLRDGFSVNDNTVSVPCLFKKINGVYKDTGKYQNIVKYCCQSDNTLVFTNNNISNDPDITEEMYSIMFCQLSDGTFDIEEIKKSSIYKYKKYSEDVQNFILKKFNEVLLRKDIYTEEFKIGRASCRERV